MEKGNGDPKGTIDPANVIVVETNLEYLGQVDPAAMSEGPTMEPKMPFVMHQAYKMVPTGVTQEGHVVNSIVGPYEMHFHNIKSWRPATEGEVEGYIKRVDPPVVSQPSAQEISKFLGR